MFYLLIVLAPFVMFWLIIREDELDRIRRLAEKMESNRKFWYAFREDREY